jgi:hypothetical protein
MGGPPMGMPAQNEEALYFASGRVFVFAPEKGMKRLLSFLAGKKPKGPLDDAIKLAGRKDYHFVGALNLPASVKMKMKDSIPSKHARFRNLLDFETVTVLMNFGDTSRMEMTCRYNTDAKAAEAKKALEDVRSIGRVGLADARDNLQALLGQAAGKQLVDAGTKTLDETTIEQQGPNVTVKMTVDSKAFEGIKLPQPGRGFGPGQGPR